MCVARTLPLSVLPSLCPPSHPPQACKECSLLLVRSPCPLPGQPEKTVYIDNVRVTFGSDKDFQQALTRVKAVGLLEVRGKAEIDQVEVGDLCQNLHAIRDGQSYTFFPPIGRLR